MITLRKRSLFIEKPRLIAGFINSSNRIFGPLYNWFVLLRLRLIVEAVKETKTALITIFLDILSEQRDVDLIVQKNLFLRFRVFNSSAIILLVEELRSRKHIQRKEFN